MWFSHEVWRIVKEPEGIYEGIMGCKYKNDFAPF